MGRRLSFEATAAFFLFFICVFTHDAGVAASNLPAGARVPDWDTTQSISFQCDSLRVQLNASEQICQGNVRVRQGNLYLCCNELLAETHKDSGRIKTLRLKGDVRARQGADAMWAEAVTYIVADHMLMLFGKPLLQRESSRMMGSQIAFDLTNREAKVTRPTGVWARAENVSLSPKITDQITDTCTLPARPLL